MISTAAVPESATIIRRLAAVAFADVVGFSALIERNDVAALQEWKELRRELIEPKIKEHHGKIMRMLGDGMFIEFGSAVDAVRCAQEIQRAIAQLEIEGRKSLRLRIGINVEDVIVDDGDLHGDGVNIAARIQQLASPGEVKSSPVRSANAVWNKLGAKFTDLGERELKNISRPVSHLPARVADPRLAVGAPAVPTLSHWMRRPTIAVLPFRNLSNDPSEAYFGEGITEDIIGPAQLLVLRHRSPLHASLSRPSR
jgi:adenylate cyclase